MAHSFDVFDAAGTHACSCQSNGGLASTVTVVMLQSFETTDPPPPGQRGGLTKFSGGFNAI
jgi:hypothetical protein